VSTPRPLRVTVGPKRQARSGKFALAELVGADCFGQATGVCTFVGADRFVPEQSASAGLFLPTALHPYASSRAIGVGRVFHGRESLMDALQRVARIKHPPAAKWPRERFQPAADEGRRRWQEAEALFAIEYPMFADAVAKVAPDFQLSPEEELVARTANVSSRIAVWYLKWERCPATVGLPNPYEPWIEICEHGGAFSVEHGQYVDIYDAEHTRVGGLTVRRA
jgi:hypothetical protein